MRIISDGRAPPEAEQSACKRRHSSPRQACHHLYETSKKRRLLTETETLTPEPLTTHSPPLRTNNTAVSSHSSFRTTHHHKHKKHHHHRIKSSTADGDRNWVYSTRTNLSHCKGKVVLLSYNILAVENASKHQDLYSKVPPKYLDWDRRKKLLCKEISRYSASILCFQEVDRFGDIDNLLQKDGFRGVYQARTGEACDGCAIFWKNELYTLLHQESIEFQMFGLRNNVAQLCVLKMTQDQSSSTPDTLASPAGLPRSLLVGNIHVLFNPKRGDIKLGQIRLFLKKAHELSQEWGNIPVVLAGDFNSMPQSAMYQFLASAELDLQLHDRRNISGAICPLKYQPSQHQNNYAASFWSSVSRPRIHRWSCEELCFATGTEGVTYLRHPLNLFSAYTGVHGCEITRDNHGEPLATSYHSKFMGTVDYIWHTPEVVPVRVLDTLPIDSLRQMGGLPSKKWCSDHLALVCEMAFSDDVNEK